MLIRIDMQNLTLSDGVSALILTADSSTQLAVLKSSGNGAAQTARLEFDQQAISVSLLNSSDLGVIVDNNGLTTIHDLAVENGIKCSTLFMKSPNGTLFRCSLDDNGNWINVAV
jgi:hypothetical protein